MKWFKALFPDLTAKLRRMIRREIHRDIQNSLITHAAARQSFDLYEMRLETLDTRIAKRIMALEARVAQLEGAPAAQDGMAAAASRPRPVRQAN